jgi:hypothetical protein
LSQYYLLFAGCIANWASAVGAGCEENKMRKILKIIMSGFAFVDIVGEGGCSKSKFS